MGRRPAFFFLHIVGQSILEAMLKKFDDSAKVPLGSFNFVQFKADAMHQWDSRPQ